MDPASGARVVTGATRLPTLLQVVAGYAAVLATVTAAWQLQHWHRERTQWVQLVVSTREVVTPLEWELTSGARRLVGGEGVDYRLGVRVWNRGSLPVTVEKIGFDRRSLPARMLGRDRQGSAPEPTWFLVPEVRIEPGEIAWVGISSSLSEIAGYDPAQRMRALVRLSSGRVISSIRNRPVREIVNAAFLPGPDHVNGWQTVDLQEVVRRLTADNAQLQRKVDRIAGQLGVLDPKVERQLRRLQDRLERTLRQR
jgi:hypothetical protein